MSDMPKEIWAWEAPELDDYETAWSIHQPHPSYDCKKSKYVRADIVEAMQAQLEAMAEASRLRALVGNAVYHHKKAKRAALDNPMTLPDAPEGWRYEEIGYALGSDFIVGIGQQGGGVHHKGSATELRQAALNAIAKIKGDQDDQ